MKYRPEVRKSEIVQCDQCPWVGCRIPYHRHKLIHDPGTTTCDICSFVGTKKQYSNHKKTHMPRILPCPHCPFMAAVETQLKNHMRVHSDDSKRFKCDQCNYNSYSSLNLKTHIARRHSTEKPFKCSHCDFAAKTNESLRKHIDLRHKEFNLEDLFKCDKCEFVTRHKANLKSHQLTHLLPYEKERIHKCDKCPKSFYTRNILIKHISKVHGEKQTYVCPICAKVFNSLERLKGHDWHHSGKKYECYICGAKYSGRGRYKWHFDTSHPNEPLHCCKVCNFKTFLHSVLKQHFLSKEHTENIQKP